MHNGMIFLFVLLAFHVTAGYKEHKIPCPLTSTINQKHIDDGVFVAQVQVKSVAPKGNVNEVKLKYNKLYWWYTYYWSDVTILRGVPTTLTIWNNRNCPLDTTKLYVLGCKMYDEPDCHFMKLEEDVTPQEWNLIKKW
ncbi:hypothetical protein ANCCAN_05743 [Ancylostoma caninum]|uniref:Transthyretin-like family protein n=1 Tax=Ancylostoma caninum TaxID=29170 RepID=A0A368GYX7_ANCCA|nr:hypothetical protein ANCCAN_05743 [Ancylostoma caninum]